MKQVLFGLLAGLALTACTKDKAAPMPPIPSEPVSFSQQIVPLINTNCSTSGCHDAGTASAGYNLTSHQLISDAANDMLNAMRGQNGFTQMPFGQAPLPDTAIQQFEAWILQGKQNN